MEPDQNHDSGRDTLGAVFLGYTVVCIILWVIFGGWPIMALSMMLRREADPLGVGIAGVLTLFVSVPALTLGIALASFVHRLSIPARIACLLPAIAGIVVALILIVGARFYKPS